MIHFFSAKKIASGRVGIPFYSKPFVADFLRLYTKKGRTVKWKTDPSQVVLPYAC
jgi:hypothetical protein